MHILSKNFRERSAPDCFKIKFKGDHIDGKKFFSINGDISTQVYEKFLKFVDEVIRSDTKEIVIIIDSNGGEITYGFAIYDILMALDIEITTIAIGKCRSIATVIFAAGDKRLITNNCYFLIHGASVNIDRAKLNAKAAKDLWESIVEDNKRILQCYLNNPELKVNIPNFTELFDSGDDLEYTPNDVVRLGFATGLLENISDIYCIPKKVEIY